MNKRRVKRAALITGLVSLLLAGGLALWVSSYRHQEDLNRQLIAALERYDPKQALALVKAGADPNTPLKPPSPLSLIQLWNRMLHRKALPNKDTLSAFHMACGEQIFSDNGTPSGLNTDEPYLVETMLQHGAQKNAKADMGWTPLHFSVVARRTKTVYVLLKHGVDVNAQNDGGTALLWAVFASSAVDPSERTKSANIVRQLLAHGADPNLPGMGGETPLQMAREGNSPDLVALLCKAGAKK
jgi:ankyrin repeat protein